MAVESRGSPKIALTTGTSSGVGMHTAVAFARAGYVSIATMRDIAKADTVRALAADAGVSVDVRPLDVEAPAAISACVDGVLADHGRIDVLINNAGAGFLGSIEQTTEEDLQRVMGANFYGVWRMTRAVFPHMRAAGSGRIISVTSVGGLIGQPFNEAYCAAKFAVEGMMEGLAPLARRMGVAVSLVEPGPINTEFVANVRATSQGTLARLTPPYDGFLAAYMGASTNVFEQYGQSGADIAAIILEAAQSETPHLRYVTSAFARQIVSPKVVDYTGDSVVDAFAARLGG
jgi:NAD(P)-dependent dehydrogenase (short-subunit alcohol dehydrogenase family)